MRSSKSCWYRIEKTFRGGCDVYATCIPAGKKVKSGMWKEQLEKWGEHTDGGHSYGYEMIPTRSKDRPRCRKTVITKEGDFIKVMKFAPVLHFDGRFLERKEKKK